MDKQWDRREIEDLALYVSGRNKVEGQRAIRVFLGHLIAFVIGNIFLGIWNVLTIYVRDDENLWFFIPLLFWGVALLIHYVNSIVLFDEWWEQDEKNIGERARG